MRVRIVLGVVLACVLLVTAAGTSVASSAYASAGFGVERYALTATEENSSVDTQGGSHPHELTAEAVLEPNAHSTSADEVKDLDFELPPGLIINPAAVPQNNAVGTVQMSVAGKIVSAAVYNLAPPPGGFARFDFTLEGAPVIADISVRTGGDYGMTLSIPDLPQWGIESVKLTLGGPSISTFLTLPTSCAGSLQTTLQGESWSGEAASLSSSFPQMTGCNRLPFDPSLSVAPDTGEADEPSGYALDLRVPQQEGPAGLARSELKSAAITLPLGTGISLSAGNGLQVCSEAQVGLGSSGPVGCPDASKIGEVKVETPLLSHPLEGAVYLATQDENPFGSLFAMYIVAEDPVSGVQVKLAGQLQPNPVTGQLTIELRELPQLPISDLELHFFGGERALLNTPPGCGLATTTSMLEPWSGDAPVSASSSFEIISGVNGTPCSEPLRFDPTFQVGSTTNEAGAYDSLTLLVTGADQEEELGGIVVQTPQAVAGMFAGVPLCGETQAAVGTCAQASRVGSVQLTMGLGREPYRISGHAYLTGPYRGAQQGLSLVVPVNFGPLDLGNTVVRASEQLDPNTRQMTIETDPLPTVLDGIPLHLTELALQLDRGEFRLNPEGCEPLTIAGTLTSTQGNSDPIFASAFSPGPQETFTRCPAPQAPVSPVVPGVSHAAANVSLASRRLTTTSHGKAAVKLTCTGTGKCVGKLTLSVEARDKGRKKGRSKPTTIGTASFSIPPGKTTTVELRLSPTGRMMLSADRGRLAATLTIRKSSPAPSQTHAENVELVGQK